MSDPFMGEIRMFAGTYAPRGWALCNGQLLAISSNSALFSLLGTNYGGDGVTTFALPNLQSRSPVGTGTGGGLTHVQLGQVGGVESTTLTTLNCPLTIMRQQVLQAFLLVERHRILRWLRPLPTIFLVDLLADRLLLQLSGQIN